MNDWITFVKKYAKKHGISYTEALSHASCKDKYMKSKMK
jgi:hypothetical protein